ncbi:hypothetical protein CRUP_032137 [Coryphaenoides rupestris]|nr:hypothetical protein CRUP_032137 [Coryphaenoides rupestris]
MKSPTGSEASRRSRRLKELLVLKAVSAPAELASVPAGVHNKENQDVARPPRPITPQDLSSSSSGQEDSGYLSLHSSQVSDEQYEETDRVQPQPPDLASPRTANTTLSSTSANSHASLSSSTPRVSVCCSSSSATPRVPLSSSTPRASCRNSNLPIVRFQQAVCAELACNFQNNHRYDWSIVSLLAEKHLLDRVIGGQMGRDHVDVFSALWSRNLRGILCRILGLLGDLDLIRAVSKTWRKIVQEDGNAMGCIQRARRQMENYRPVSRVVPGSGLTRDSGLPRVALSGMQTLASTSSRSSPVPLEQTRFDTFLQAASSLKQDEGLRCCRRCNSPARLNAQAQRATCMRSSCQFDFCTHCQEAFHGARPCRTLQPPCAHTTGPGRPRSKHSLRRL